MVRSLYVTKYAPCGNDNSNDDDDALASSLQVGVALRPRCEAAVKFASTFRRLALACQSPRKSTRGFREHRQACAPGQPSPRMPMTGVAVLCRRILNHGYLDFTIQKTCKADDSTRFKTFHQPCANGEIAHGFEVSR